MIRAAHLANIFPLVRVESNAPSIIRKVLELGASGVIIPRVNTRDDAIRAVNAVKFPPKGSRGISSYAPESNYGLVAHRTYIERSNRESVVVIMIEEPIAVSCIADILSVEGIDAVLFGPVDFFISAGLPDRDHPEVKETMSTVHREARKRGLAIMVDARLQLRHPETPKGLVKKGANLVILGSDIFYLRHMARETIAKFKPDIHQTYG